MPHPHPRWKGKRQRFYARNAVKTTLDTTLGLGTGLRRSAAPRHLMRSFSASPANPEYHARIHPVLTSFADECVATRLIAYVGALALLGIWSDCIYGTNCRRPGLGSLPVSLAGAWCRARARPSPSARLIRPKNQRLTRSFDPEGGRKDVFHWGPSAKSRELELYRPGGEFSQSEAISF